MFWIFLKFMTPWNMWIGSEKVKTFFFAVEVLEKPAVNHERISGKGTDLIFLMEKKAILYSTTRSTFVPYSVWSDRVEPRILRWICRREVAPENILGVIVTPSGNWHKVRKFKSRLQLLGQRWAKHHSQRHLSEFWLEAFCIFLPSIWRSNSNSLNASGI